MSLHNILSWVPPRDCWSCAALAPNVTVQSGTLLKLAQRGSSALIQTHNKSPWEAFRIITTQPNLSILTSLHWHTHMTILLPKYYSAQSLRNPRLEENVPVKATYLRTTIQSSKIYRISQCVTVIRHELARAVRLLSSALQSFSWVRNAKKTFCFCLATIFPIQGPALRSRAGTMKKG